MERKEFYKLINEEIGSFDFLSMDKLDKDVATDEMLQSKGFQVKLINDICTNDNSAISNIDTMYREEDKWDTENSEFDFYIEFNYDYFGDEIPMYITIEGSINFPEDTSITFFSVDGKKVNFNWIEKNEDLKKKFVDCLVSEYKS
jgi:hypothetical protein